MPSRTRSLRRDGRETATASPSTKAVALFRRWRWVVVAVVAFFVVAGFVPPLRGAVVAATSRVVLAVAAPITPSTEGFGALPRPSVVLSSEGEEVGTIGSKTEELVPLRDVPEHVRHAVLAAEDANFYDHSGVDPYAVVRALVNNVVRPGEIQGGSTITQQLAKLNYTGSERTLYRKVRELLYAARLERAHTKDELLEHYLNQVYFGQSAWGLGTAADRFFGVDPSELTVAQAALLAGKIHAPEALDPRSDVEAVRARRDHVIDAMERHGWIGAGDARRAKAGPVDVTDDDAVISEEESSAPHFVSYVRREAAGLRELAGSEEARAARLNRTGGLRIETTLDSDAQRAAVAAVTEHLGREGDPTTAVVSVVPGDGAIRALVSGLDPGREFDLATRGRRQPGSSFKPFVYLAMLEEGIDPRSSFDSSSPKTIDCGGEPWEVDNYEGDGSGRMTVDDATTRSVNVVYAQLIAEVGPDRVAQVARDAGISEDAVRPPVCAMGLGGLRQGVSPLEQAAAYATFAAGGVYAKPYAITRVTDRDGRVLFDRSADARRVFARPHVGVLNAALQRVVTSGTGRAARIGRPLAGKTGTTNDFGNAWFVGYVPQLATAVWVGDPDADVPMTDVRGRRVSGGSFPARVFATYMRDAIASVPAVDLYTASADRLDLRRIDAGRRDVPTTTVRPDRRTTPEPTPQTVTPAPTSEPPATKTPERGRTPKPPPTPKEDDDDGDQGNDPPTGTVGPEASPGPPNDPGPG